MRNLVFLVMTILTCLPCLGAPPDEVVVTVNGESLSRGMLDRLVIGTMASLDQQGAAVAPDEVMGLRRLVVEQVIDNILLAQAARAAGIAIPPEDVDKELASFLGTAGSTEALQARLVELGMSLQELKKHLERDLLAVRYLDSLLRDETRPSPEEIDRFYEENRGRFKRPEEIRARHILIPADSRATPEQHRLAREKATLLRDRARAGEEFATLATENSSCASAKVGGDLGFFTRGQMVPAFEEVAWVMKPGEISDVITTRFGYHVIRLLERHPPVEISLEAARDQIAAQLQQVKFRSGTSKILEALRAKADIRR